MPAAAAACSIIRWLYRLVWRISVYVAVSGHLSFLPEPSVQLKFIRDYTDCTVV